MKIKKLKQNGNFEKKLKKQKKYFIEEKMIFKGIFKLNYVF